MFYKFTGLYCPGCGGNRAIISMLKFDFYQALKYNFIITFLIPIGFIYFITKYILKINIKVNNSIWRIILIVVLVFGIIRNIPLFSFLAPTIVI